MKWLYRIFSRLAGCRHRWKIIQTIELYSGSYSAKNQLPHGHKYTLQCKICGDIAFRKS